MIDATEKIYPTKVLLAVSECSPETFRAWRRRNGILANEPCGRGQKFSAVDCAVLRIVVILVRNGLTPSAAARFIPHIVWALVAALEGDEASGPIALSRGPFASAEPGMLSSVHPGDPDARRHFISEWTDPAALAAELGVYVVVDLRGVVEHVRARLEGTDANRTK